jgi:hypothetical protein
MSKSIVIRTAAAALLAGMLLPVASFAQTGDRASPNFNPFGGPAQACTQLELSVGLTGDECGKLTLSEIAALKADRDNVN